MFFRAPPQDVFFRVRPQRMFFRLLLVAMPHPPTESGVLDEDRNGHRPYDGKKNRANEQHGKDVLIAH